MTLNVQLYLLNLVNMHSHDDILDVSGSFPKKTLTFTDFPATFS